MNAIPQEKKTVVSLGEMLLAFAPDGYRRFLQSETVTMYFVGSEYNTLCSLSRYGIPCRMLTKVPEHTIGDCAIAAVRKYGVDANMILRGGERIGQLFLEKGASQRADSVIYDRKHSAIAEAKPEEFDFDAAFSDAAWFHTTGITPALSVNAADFTLQAMQKAKKLGLTISFDLNYRSKLWSLEDAGKVLEELMPYVDILSANEWDLQTMFKLPLNISGGMTDETFVQAANLAKERFGIKMLTATRREVRSASDNRLQGMLCADGQLYKSRAYDMHIVNRVGGGDAYTAGVIYSVLEKKDLQSAVEFAAAADCLKHTIEGDVNLCSLQEVEHLAKSGEAGRIQR